jgi:hypothetical protein
MGLVGFCGEYRQFILKVIVQSPYHYIAWTLMFVESLFPLFMVQSKVREKGDNIR